MKNHIDTSNFKALPLLYNSQMKAAEQYGISNGIPSLILMENAAYNIKTEVLKLAPKHVLVLAGKGNNGGDGLAAARQLITAGIDVSIIFVGEPEKATPDCKTNFGILKNFGADIQLYDNINILHEYIQKCSVIVDSLIGTGLTRQLSGKYAEIVNAVNAGGKTVISVDCPTGVNTDTGEDYGIAVNADTTITFHCPKTGMLLYPSFGRMGRLIIGDIGMPYGNEQSKGFVLTKSAAAEILPKRTENSHKGTYGKAVIIAGCSTMTGAAVFNVKSAYNSGCGLVRLCSAKHAVDVVQNAVPEAVTEILDETDGYIDSSFTDGMSSADCIAIGSGMGCTNASYNTLKAVLKKRTCPIVIDADGLNTISQHSDLLDILGENTVITPHIKEMSRLSGIPSNEISKNMISSALNFAEKHNTVVVLKSAHTVIASPDGRYCINTTGCSAMSKGGSGDCLTGTIASLIAQGSDCFNAAVLAAYINGLAGEAAAEEYGEYGVSASAICEFVSKIIKNLN